jgi:uncharacterized protein YjiS (DUF1127 family)
METPDSITPTGRKDLAMTPRTLTRPAPTCRPGTGLLGWLARAAALRRERAALLRLDDRLLRDIALTRHDAAAEAVRPAWNAPDRWKC